MLEYILFFFTCLWSCFFIKVKSNFSQKANILFSIFVIKVSYITLFSSIFFGFFNFGFKKTLIGFFVSIVFVQVVFIIGKKYLLQKKNYLDKVIKFKSYFEYSLIIFLFIYLFFKFY